MEDVKQLTPKQIMNLGMAFGGSKTLLSAVELGLFTELAKEPLGLDTLSERLMLHSRSAGDFLDALVALGMLERNGDQYENTPERMESKDGRTILTGEVKDQPHLFGVLARLNGLGLELLSMHVLSEEAPERDLEPKP